MVLGYQAILSSQHRRHDRQPGSMRLAPTANLLYLAAHLFLKHRGASGRLLWLYDLHLLLRDCREVLDWDAVLSKADEFGWTSALYGALLAVQGISVRSCRMGFWSESFPAIPTSAGRQTSEDSSPSCRWRRVGNRWQT